MYVCFLCVFFSWKNLCVCWCSSHGKTPSHQWHQMHPMVNCSVERSGTSRQIKPPSEAVKVEQVPAIRTDLLKPCLRALSLRRFARAEETRGSDPRESAQRMWCNLTRSVSWMLKHRLQGLTDFGASAAEALPLEHLHGGKSLTDTLLIYAFLSSTPQNDRLYIIKTHEPCDPPLSNSLCHVIWELTSAKVTKMILACSHASVQLVH